MSPVTVTTAQQRFLDAKMNQVSRSFALVVPFLEAPLRQWMATAYLICRVIDNIEDSGLSYTEKIQRYDEFDDLLDQPEQAAIILAAWERTYWPGLTKDETALMGVDGGLPLWQIYGAIPERAQRAIAHWASEMARGMAAVDDSSNEPWTVQHADLRLLQREQDYDLYCYFVAGTVGHMSTELVVQHYDLDAEAASRLLVNCEACGRALQKTNIVKDFAKDLKRGVSFLPDEWLRRADYSPLSLAGASLQWKSDVLNDVLAELRDGVAYVQLLPHVAKGYRLASLMCLLPAYQTILLAAKQQHILFTAQHHVKISKLSMAQCVKDAHRMLHDDEAIVAYSRSMEEQIEEFLGMPLMVAG